ncbi:MAG: hypothetical protein IMW91_00220 [Firmicutes bacterium]|nr:hypothetical protein [Bacillota bacterium]
MNLSVLDLSLSGLRAIGRQMDGYAGNIAHATDAGYLPQVVQTGEALAQAADAPTDVGARPGVWSGGATTQVWLGGAGQTIAGLAEDVAAGDGLFLAVLHNGQPRYVNWVHLTLDAAGQVTDGRGNLILDANGQPFPPLRGAQALQVTADGQLVVQTAMGRQTLGTLSVGRFAQPAALAAAGEGTYAATPASGPFIGMAAAGNLLPGMQRLSGVALGDALSGLMIAQAAYQANAAVLDGSNRMLARLNQTVS